MIHGVHECIFQSTNIPMNLNKCKAILQTHPDLIKYQYSTYIPDFEFMNLVNKFTLKKLPAHVTIIDVVLPTGASDQKIFFRLLKRIKMLIDCNSFPKTNKVNKTLSPYLLQGIFHLSSYIPSSLLLLCYKFYETQHKLRPRNPSCVFMHTFCPLLPFNTLMCTGSTCLCAALHTVSFVCSWSARLLRTVFSRVRREQVMLLLLFFCYGIDENKTCQIYESRIGRFRTDFSVFLCLFWIWKCTATGKHEWPRSPPAFWYAHLSLVCWCTKHLNLHLTTSIQHS